MGGKKVVWLVFVVLLAGFVFGAEENVVLSTYLDDEVYVGQEYTKLFKIQIKNQVDCKLKKDLITVYYNITNGELVKEDIFEREIGCSGTANTGEFIPSKPGEYVLCGKLINTSTAGNSDLSDDIACKSFTVLDTSSVPCDIWLNITFDNFIYQEGEKIKFKTELNDETFPFGVEYWIEDSFGEYHKNSYVSENTNQKTWTTKIEEDDRVLWIKARVNASCNDTDLSNNYDEKMFIVLGSIEEELVILDNEEQDSDSSIEIVGVKPEEVSFGDVFSAELNIYKNSTGKYSLSIWAEKDGKKISEKTKFHLKTKDREYRLFLPVQLDPNCNEKIDDGDAELIVEGLGLRVEKEFEISGINEKSCEEVEKIIEKECEECGVCKEAKESSSYEEENILDGNLVTKKGIVDEISGIVIYESSSEKAKGMIPYLMIAFLGILSLVLVWKRI